VVTTALHSQVVGLQRQLKSMQTEAHKYQLRSSLLERMMIGSPLERMMIGSPLNDTIDKVPVSNATDWSEGEKTDKNIKNKSSQDEEVGRIAGMDEGTVGRIAGMYEGTVGRIAGMDEGTVGRIAGMDEGSVGKVLRLLSRTLRNFRGIFWSLLVATIRQLRILQRRLGQWVSRSNLM